MVVLLSDYWAFPQVILGPTEEPLGKTTAYSKPFITVDNFPTRSLAFIRYSSWTSVVKGEILAKTPLVKEASPDTESWVTLLTTAAVRSLEMLY